MTPRVMFYVQHLWGVGHVYRATRIAHGLSRNGFEVHLVWGGTDVPGFDFSGLTCHRLQPVRTHDVSFSKLLHTDGREFTQQDQDARRNILVDLFGEIKPDVLITEAFPFGRRQMRFELLPLLEAAIAAENKPLIAASIRDIMQEDRKQSRVDESVELVSRFYDLVLVHGDKEMIAIEETLQGVDSFLDKVRYTGLVIPEPAFQAVPVENECDVVISVGGGAFGHELAKIGVEAALKSPTEKWLIVAGSQMPEEDFLSLKNTAGSAVRLVRHVDDLKSIVRQASVSVSHAGYNTVADIFCANTPAVLYPYTGGRETEQLRRARILENKGFAVMIEPDCLSVNQLKAAVENAKLLSSHDVPFAIDGANETANIIQRALELRR